MNPSPELDHRMATLIRVEGDRVMLCLGSWGLTTHDMPTTLVEYIEQVEEMYQRSSGVPEVDLIQSLRQLAEELSESDTKVQFIGCRPGQCYYVDYAGGNIPSNFVAVGDSVMRLNPAFGQGVSKALMDATSLCTILYRTHLDLSRSGGPSLPATFAKEYFQRQLPRSLALWKSTKDQDYKRLSTIPCQGEAIYGDKHPSRAFERGLLRYAAKDKEVAHVLVTSLQMVRPKFDLLHPSILFRVLWDMWTSGEKC
jgi:2-polyprenyl-6-methoxyphenol hydroxylase-like FAD-dependent oxidoreductase